MKSTCVHGTCLGRVVLIRRIVLKLYYNAPYKVSLSLLVAWMIRFSELMMFDFKFLEHLRTAIHGPLSVKVDHIYLVENSACIA